MSIQRSWLFVPGDKQKMIKNTKDLETDIIIFDLEDSVLEKNKLEAIKNINNFISYDNDYENNYYVRINNDSSQSALKDITSIFNKKIKGFILPKSECPNQIICVDRKLSQLEKEQKVRKGEIKVIPLIESAKGVLNAFELGKSSNRVKCLAFGSLDYILDIDAEETSDRLEIFYAQYKLVVASRAAGIEPPIDTVFPDIENINGLYRESEYAKKLGFQGKLLIHPSQIDVINKVFSPTLTDIEEAKKIINII